MVEQLLDRAIAIEAEHFHKVRADRNCLKQVLLTTRDNAVKYSDSDTPITLKMKLAENALIKSAIAVTVSPKTTNSYQALLVDELVPLKAAVLGLYC